MSDTNTTSRSLKGPVDNVSYSYGSDTNLDESEDLLPSNQRTDNPNEGRLLKDWEGFMTLFKTNLGTGILGLPFAMKNAGIAIKTHSSSGSRERYFADDDKHDLKSLFQHEKEGNSIDYNNMLSRLSSKGNKSLDSDNFTLDDMFESNLSRELTPGQKYERERRKAAFEQQKLMERQSKCQLCIDNSNFDKHLLIALGVKVYLSLPSHRPLTAGHCIISTMSHEVARTSLDEDILHEINVYRKGLTKMFAEKGMTAIFMESCMNLRRQYHLCIHCIPVPQEIGEMSPIYFKKAILEADTEWAQNKKLVSFNESKLTHSIPKGFPYFAVEFELNGGFAHVIEDENLFPSYFGQEIVGGMLDIEPYLWRRPPKENFNQQQKRVIEFSKWWKPYDWTQKIER